MLFKEALKECWAGKFMGNDSNSMIQILDETSKGPGDKVTVTLRMQLSGAGVEGDSTLEGEEEALATHTDALLINQLRHAVRNGGKMSQQRVPFSVREEALSGLKDWVADRMDTAVFNQLCGNTAQSDTRFTGHNATVAPTSTRWIYADGNTAETGLTIGSSDQFVLSLIDTAIATAKTATPQIRPVRVKGEPYYIVFLDTWQAKQLRAAYSTGAWGDIQKAAMSGGQISDSPIFTGALGVYSGAILHETTRLYSGNFTDAGTTRCSRALLCGAQAAALGYGQDAGQGGDRMSWVEELFDYNNQLGVGVGMIWGVKKTVDFGRVAPKGANDNLVNSGDLLAA